MCKAGRQYTAHTRGKSRYGLAYDGIADDGACVAGCSDHRLSATLSARERSDDGPLYHRVEAALKVREARR